MRRLDWWLGVLIVAGALLVHALVPRYEWRQPSGLGTLGMIRVDRWTGRTEVGRVQDRGDNYGRWVSWRRELWNTQQASRR